MENNNLGENKKEKSGIAGWLIIPAIGITLAPVVSLLVMFTDWSTLAMFDKEDPSTIVNFALFSFIMAILLFVFSIYFVVIFWKKKKRFIKEFIIFLVIATIIYAIQQIWAVALSKGMAVEILARLSESSDTIFLNEATFSLYARAAEKIIFSAVISLVWILYMLASKRVRNTFIK